jgi:uncharacterized protein
MICEGIVTTVNADGTPNIAPMGPMVDPAMSRLVLRPYPTSTTYANLVRTGEGVFHVTDDVELLAHTAVGDVQPPPALREAVVVRGQVLADACRWYELRVEARDDRQVPARITCQVVHQARNRDFFGFNRAKHAVVEAAILATRVQRLSAADVLAQYERLAVLVDKTAGPQERRAFEYLYDYVRRAFGVA